jgi:hypothetical protein
VQRGGFSNSYELLKEFNIHHQEKRFVKRQHEKMGLEQYDDGKHFYGAFLARLMLYLSCSRILMAQTIMTYGHVRRLKVNYLK